MGGAPPWRRPRCPGRQAAAGGVARLGLMADLHLVLLLLLLGVRRGRGVLLPHVRHALHDVRELLDEAHDALGGDLGPVGLLVGRAGHLDVVLVDEAGHLGELVGLADGLDHGLVDALAELLALAAEAGELGLGAVELVLGRSHLELRGLLRHVALRALGRLDRLDLAMVGVLQGVDLAPGSAARSR